MPRKIKPADLRTIKVTAKIIGVSPRKLLAEARRKKKV